MEHTRTFHVDDLPKVSPWPHRLLGISEFHRAPRTSAENHREYNDEKWKTALVSFNDSGIPLSFEDYTNLETRNAAPTVCYLKGKLIELSAIESLKVQVELIYETIKAQLPAANIMELGAGTGRVIFSLLKKIGDESVSAIAGEFAETGRELITAIATANRLPVRALPCDFLNDKIIPNATPDGALILTSMSVVCIPSLPENFIDNLISLKPKAVVHYEPILEHCDTDSILGCMRRRYLEINHYNQNLLRLLHKAQEDGKIIIKDEIPSVFGSNPFLVGSMITWIPT